MSTSAGLKWDITRGKDESLRFTSVHALSVLLIVFQPDMKMTAIIPYRIAVPDEKLEKLHQKLKLTEFPDELEDAQWKYGVPLYVYIFSSK
jgi:hypothetical protein